MVYTIISILFSLGVPIAIIWGMVRFFKKRSKGVSASLCVFDSKEDALAQVFLLLAVSFLGVSLVSILRDSMIDEVSLMNILLVVFFAGFALAYRYRSVLNLLVWFVSIVGWWVVKAAEYWLDAGVDDVKPYSILLGLIIIAFASYVMGYVHRSIDVMQNNRFSFVYFLLGGGFLLTTLFILSTKIGLDVFEEMLEGASVFASFEIFISLLLFTAVLLAGIAYTNIKNLISTRETLIILIATAFFTALLYIPSVELIEGGGRGWFEMGALTTPGLIYALIFNMVLFIGSLGIIVWGAAAHRVWMVNMGVALLSLIIITKYFDWFFSFLDKSIFFIGAGLILFALGWFMERKRRTLIAEIHTEREVTDKDNSNEAI